MCCKYKFHIVIWKLFIYFCTHSLHVSIDRFKIFFKFAILRRFCTFTFDNQNRLIIYGKYIYLLTMAYPSTCVTYIKVPIPVKLRKSHLSKQYPQPIFKLFIRRFILNDIEHKKLFYDSKTILQEVVQREYPGEELVYRIIGEYGPAHDRHFEAEAVIGSKTLGRGHGSAKKSAEMEAAYRALIELKQRGIHVS